VIDYYYLERISKQHVEVIAVSVSKTEGSKVKSLSLIAQTSPSIVSIS
jgi:hypothetical protein